MADVLIVCVREDETQAKALADMFEAAGFSVGGAPSNDASLRSSGAGVVVWSQASIRSRPFLDAAQRVINAGKGVLACLIEPPPPESVSDSPAFDLTGWTGDANDPSLDPLFFAVDRMVNSARTAVGAAPVARAAEPQTYESPHLRTAPPGASAPPYARARTAPPSSQPPQPSLPPGFQMRGSAPARDPDVRSPHDPLGNEAEHWRSIRHSKDPTAFLDYLARYGPEGAFAELAEYRLKQLEGTQVNLRDAARAASSEPVRNYDPPLRRRPEPTRAYEPPPRRVDPPPPPPPIRLEPRLDPPPAPRRREPARETVREAPREPAYDRDYRPPIDERDSSTRREGGFLRMLVLIVLLGGGAVAAGIYFGLGDQLQAITAPGAHPAAPVASTPAPAESEPASSPTDSASNRTNDIPQAQVVGGPQTASSPPPAPTPARPRPTQVASTQSTSRNTNNSSAADTTPPPPQTSWGNQPFSNGGPVSLVPNASAPSNPPPQQVASVTPPTIATTSSSPTATASVRWASRPSGDRLASSYPRNALRSGTAGTATLDCVIRADFGVTCFVASETPAGAGFGRAALNVVSYYRSQAVLSDGSSAVGAHTRVSIAFRAPSE